MTAAASTVFAADEQRDVALDLDRWSRLARLVLDEERVSPLLQVAVVFVDESTITALNEQFLGHQGSTDVLAFPIDDELPTGGRSPDQGGRGPGVGDEQDEPPVLLGDVYVCPAVAARQAAERSIPLAEELALLVVHGLLHLLEYDHAQPDQAEAMQRRERELLARFAESEATGGGDAVGEAGGDPGR